MGFRVREYEAEGKFSGALDLEAIGRAVPMSEIEESLARAGVDTAHERKLNVAVTVLVVIAMSLWRDKSIGRVLRMVSQGLRFVWWDPDIELAGESALAYRRRQVGARPLWELFHRVCQPMATPDTPGAFQFGLRLMAIDGAVVDVADTPANARVFGRSGSTSSRGQSAFPQVQAVYLCECGTHGIVDCGFWSYRTSERVGAARVLRSVRGDMLVMYDAGLHSFDLLLGIRKRGGHALGRLPDHVKPEVIRALSDGSLLARLAPSDRHRRRNGEHLIVRIIEYTVTDPALPGYGETRRLVTTLLDETAQPAFEIACAYHERWEVEITIDEIETHQGKLSARPLRSLTPVGVIQELYGLLIAHFAVRHLMHEAALVADIDPDRLSFVHALTVIQQAVPEFQMVHPDQLDQLHARLLRDIAAGRLPPRRPRSNPRVVKRKMSKFRLKRSEHFQWPQPSRPFRASVSVLMVLDLTHIPVQTTSIDSQPTMPVCPLPVRQPLAEMLI
jgi:hypothetical protein